MSGFDLHPARSLDEALELLARFGEDAQLLAGGTSLMVLARLGLLGAEHVVDLRGIAELTGVDVSPDGALRIGALHTLRTVENDPQVRQHTPALAETLHQVATVRVRNQATIGGNLAHADPAQDPPPMLMALGARVDVTSPDRPRTIEVNELFAGHFETTLFPGEVLTHVVVPPLPAGARAGYLKFLPGSQDDYATVSVAVAGEVPDGRCAWLRVALGGVAPTPVRAHAVEAALTGRPLDAAAVADAAQLVTADIAPISDLRGSAQYKRRVAAVCVRRALEHHLLGHEEAR